MALKIEILTLFPEYFRSPFSETMIGRALESGVVAIKLTNIRDFAKGKHKQCDDVPFGGGAGMVMKPEPVVAAIEYAREECDSLAVLLSPKGRVYNQRVAEELAGSGKKIVLICGRYEGIDERVRLYIDDEISIGDYILSGGESAALVVVETLYRLLPNALGNAESAAEESFSKGLLEYPQYTRPRVFRGRGVPETLVSGNHKEIARWREMASLAITRRLRKDLFDKIKIDDRKAAELDEWERENEYDNSKV